MAAAMSFVALALAAVCGSVRADEYNTSVNVSPSDVSTTLPAYYPPTDSADYSNLMKNLYGLNSALTAANFAAQNLYDYFYLYKNNPALFSSDYNLRLTNLAYSQSKLSNMYNSYMQALEAYTRALNPMAAANMPNPPVFYTK